MKQPQKRKKSNWVRLFFLHRYIGLSIAFFVVLLSITGILLNHTEELRLHSHNVNSPWLMSLYGIESSEVKSAYPVADSWVIALGKTIYLNQQELKCKPPLNGAILKDDLMIIASQAQLCLVTPDGELIDYLILETGNHVSRIGHISLENKTNRIVLDTMQGLLTINSDYTELIALQQIEAVTKQPVQWLEALQPPASISTSLKRQYQGDGLPYERIILDLHSGRIVGILGVYFMDLIALLLIFIALSGVAMWAKRSFKKK